GSSGVADLRTGAPIDDRSLFVLASTTKTFVATMVLRLYEQGRFGLDDPIAPYVPSYVPDAGEVTVRELLGHTAGYPDAEGEPMILRWLSDPNHRWSRAQLMRRQKPVRSPPGARFRYCNSCYVMLGALVESASRGSVGDAYRRLIEDPLELTGETAFVRSPASAERIVHGYDGRDRKDTFSGARRLGVPTGDWGTIWTDGGLAATARGVARFTDALFGGRVLRPATLAQMVDPGPNRTYGLGTYRMRFDGHRWQGNDGFYYGFTSTTMYDADRKLTLTVLTNLTDRYDPAFAMWQSLARVVDALGL
ncbi:MAG: beta-lactamase family protein, partial [Candidatus Eremiobacteraeota bacterium]|nr:beta-lactamase family protein [Candidatus Eremiobacteraeota bacterium]